MALLGVVMIFFHVLGAKLYGKIEKSFNFLEEYFQRDDKLIFMINIFLILRIL